MDEALDLDKLRRQEPAEFTRFVRTHQQIVVGLCQALGLGAADADDAAAEVFAIAYRALPKFRGESRLATWVYRIAYRTILRVRRNRVDPAEPSLELADPSCPAPDAAAETAEWQQRIWAAVARLEPEQATVVELFYRRGWSVDDIAAVLEKPPGTIKTHLFRARARLRLLLGHLENTT